MSSGLETSVYMIRDFPIPEKTPTGDDQWIRMYWKDVKVVQRHFPDVEVEASSSHVEAITGYARAKAKEADIIIYIYLCKVKKSSQERFLILKEVLENNSRTGYDVYVHKRKVEYIGSLLPKPFLLIKWKLKAPAADGHGDVGRETTFELRFELTDMLKSSDIGSDGFYQRRRLLQFPSTGTAVPLCDVVLGWREPSSPIRLNATSFGGNLFQRESSKDVVLVVGNGAEIRCHKVILEAHSDVLAAMLSPGNGMKESESGRVEMPENSEEGITQLLRYLYGMELKTKALTCDIVVELLKTGDKYKLEQLAEALIKLLLNRGKGWYTPDDLVELYFHVKNMDQLKSLQEHLISIMLSLSEEIRVCERFREIKRTDAGAAMELMWKILDTVKKKLPTETEAMEDD